MYRANIRLYPTDIQIEKINLACAVNRKVYNYWLEQKIQAHTRWDKLSCFDIDKVLRNSNAEEWSWIKWVSKWVRQTSLSRLDNAFTRFFKKQNWFPKFKKYKSAESFDILDIKFRNNKIYIPVIWDVKYSWDVPEWKIKTCTVKRLSTNKFEISLIIDDWFTHPPKEEFTREDVLWIDVGIKQFCITSNGEFIDNPKWLDKKKKKLTREQRSLSRKVKWSNNRNKQRIQVALVHEKISNQRKDFHHKLSKRLVMENKAIAVEDLNITGMVKNRHLSKAISQVGWGSFISMLDYKCNKHWKTLLAIWRFKPSSKTCSNCWCIDDEQTLSDRVYDCKFCWFKIDRDLNASINIKNFSLKV